MIDAIIDFVLFVAIAAVVLGVPILAGLWLMEKATPYIAKMYREPPVCGVCGTQMEYTKHTDLWAWDCPNLFREDHHVERGGGWEGWTTEKQQTECSC